MWVQAAMEAHIKKEAEMEKLPYKAVTQLSEVYQIYDTLLIDEKTLPALSKENDLILSDDQQCPIEEAKKKIEVEAEARQFFWYFFAPCITNFFKNCSAALMVW